jgi:hypothetical protein
MDRSSTTAAEADVLGFDFHREAPPPLGDAASACNCGYRVNDNADRACRAE